MAKEIPSAGDLRRKSEVTDDKIEADTVALKDESAKPFAFKSGHTIDVTKAIEMHQQARKLLGTRAPRPACAARW